MQIRLILTFPVAAHFCVVCNKMNFLQEFNSKFALLAPPRISCHTYIYTHAHIHTHTHTHHKMMKSCI